MKNSRIILIGIVILSFSSCRQKIPREITNYDYFDISKSKTLALDTLYAITDEEYLQYGARVAYVNEKGDTIIPFGKYAYYGTDSFVHFTTVMEHPNDSTYGRQVGINRKQQILFDIVMFDNGPEPIREGLLRVIRNGKMGYADEYGKIMIPCIYDYVNWFYKGTAEVTFDAEEYWDMDEHLIVESDEWFFIDKNGNKIKDLF